MSFSQQQFKNTSAKGAEECVITRCGLTGKKFVMAIPNALYYCFPGSFL